MVEKSSQDFIYLDNAASSPVLSGVSDALEQWQGISFVNPSSGHKLGRSVRREIKRCREQFLSLLGIKNADLIWTSGGTESNNLAIFGTVNNHSAQIVSSSIEHASVSTCLERLEREGLIIHRVAVGESGKLNLESLKKRLTAETRLVTISLVQSETGVVQDLAAIRKCMNDQAPNALLHVDGVQALGKREIPWETAAIDLLSVSSHKIHGPGSIGALIVRSGITLKAQMLGGGQQNGQRSGSLDAAAIIGFTTALELLAQHDSNRIVELKASLIEELKTLVDGNGDALQYQVNSCSTASPWIVSIAFKDYQGAVLMRFLSEEGIMVSTGSACAAESSGPSKALLAMGLSREEAFGTLRISFGLQNTMTDVTALIHALQLVIKNY